MYCPTCFNNSFYLKPKGVVEVIINGKQMDAGRFLFNLDESKKELVIEDLYTKLEEFFKWYSTFKNQPPIRTIGLTTSDFKCSQNCALPLTLKLSIIDLIIDMATLKTELERLAKIYSLVLDLDL